MGGSRTIPVVSRAARRTMLGAISRWSLGLALAAALAACLLSPGRASAGGLILYEVGTEDVGLASAGYSARAQDASTVLTNPAGMTRLAGSQLLFGTQLLYGDLELGLDQSSTSPQLGTDNGGNPIGALPGGGFFYTRAMSPKLSLGLASVGNFGLTETYDDGWAGRYYIESATLLGISFLPSIAYRASDKLSVGASLNAMYGISKTQLAVNNPTSTSDGELNMDDNEWGFGGNFGLLYEAKPGMRFGITYNSQVSLDFTTPAEFTGLASGLDSLLGAAGLLNADIDLGMKVPQGVMGSFFAEANDQWALLGSVGWQQWSRFGKVDVTVDSNNPQSLTADLDFRDTWHGALGAQKKAGPSWRLDFGVAYDSGFQPGPDFSPAIPANWAWRFATGAQHDAGEKFSWGLSAEYSYGGTLDVNEQSLAPVAVGGRGNLVGAYENTGAFFFAANFGWKL